MNGFFPVSRIERIDPEKETKIHVILEHQTGSINVSAKAFSDAYPARFYLDGKLMGRPPLTMEDVTAGTHTYRFEADNHQEVSADVVVNLDEEVKIKESLKPLPGIVTLRSAPSGAVIWVDGKKSKQKTDVRAKIPAGKHTITLKLDSYVDAEKGFEVFPGSVLEEQFRLIKNQGRINVASIPEGAAIWMDGEDTRKKTDVLMEVLAGEHELALKLDGYKDVRKKMRLEPEGFAEVEFRLEKGVSIVVPEPTFTDPVTGMEFVYVPGGSFMMGDVFGDGDENEKPVHKVTLSAFYIGRYPVTEAQWEKLIGETPSTRKKGGNYPVTHVSWNAAQQFIEKLAAINKGKYEFRLPTEAEWEYAARSGGKNEKYAGGNDVDAVAWYFENSHHLINIGDGTVTLAEIFGSDEEAYNLIDENMDAFLTKFGESDFDPKDMEGTSLPIGKKDPNGLGLYDMSGNIYEWCQDSFGDYPLGSVIDPKGPSTPTTSFKVRRGGGCTKEARECRSSHRGDFGTQDFLANDQGFRLAMIPAPLIHNTLSCTLFGIMGEPGPTRFWNISYRISISQVGNMKAFTLLAISIRFLTMPFAQVNNM